MTVNRNVRNGWCRRIKVTLEETTVHGRGAQVKNFRLIIVRTVRDAGVKTRDLVVARCRVDLKRTMAFSVADGGLRGSARSTGWFWSEYRVIVITWCNFTRSVDCVEQRADKKPRGVVGTFRPLFAWFDFLPPLWW